MPLNFAWKNQRELKKESIPTQHQIVLTARQIPDNQHRALFILAYLTAGRISEIIPTEHIRKNHYKRILKTNRMGDQIHGVLFNEYGSPMIEKVEKKEINYPGIRTNDIWFENKNNKQIMMVTMQNRKNKQFKRKTIPCPVEKEHELISMLNEYIKPLPENTQLFNFKYGKAWKIINETGYNPHFLRDIRLTHLITVYDFNVFQLVKFAGWKNSQPAERYIRLGTSDIIENFYKNESST